jgi:CBS-domain-containing membrane protein
VEKAAGRTAGDVMTAPAITVLPGASVVVAARLLDSAGIKRLPVVDANGRLCGIVTQHDLVKVFLRKDDAIADYVREDLSRLFGTTTLPVTVAVAEGVVALTGELDSNSLLPIAVHVAERVDGAIEVVSNLTYRFDDASVVANIP